MNAPRTPAPWVIEDSCIKGPHRCVARLDWSIRDAVDDANARLIAAAPELLGALKMALGKMDDWNQDGPTIRQIKAAIAKAEGDAP